MSVIDTSNKHTIKLSDNEVYFQNFCETDPNVVHLLKQAEDEVQLAHQILQVGAATLGVSADTVSAELIDKKFESLAQRMEDNLRTTLIEIGASLDGFVEEDTGALPKIFAAYQERLLGHLADAFDPESAQSVIATMNKMLLDARDQQIEAITEFVNNEEDGPLALLGRALTNEIRRTTTEVSADVLTIAEKLAVKEAVGEVLAKSPAKGLIFEDQVCEIVADLVAPFGGVAEGVGHDPGVTGSRKGDVVVTLASDSNVSDESRFVIEAKTRKMGSRKILEELEEALENREATAAVAVFDSQQAAPTNVPFHCHGDKAIAVYDGEDDGALRLALMWANWVARRESNSATFEDINAERVETLLATALAQLNRFSTVNSQHTSAKRAIDRASETVSDIKDDLTVALNDLSTELEMESH